MEKLKRTVYPLVCPHEASHYYDCRQCLKYIGDKVVSSATISLYDTPKPHAILKPSTTPTPHNPEEK